MHKDYDLLNVLCLKREEVGQKAREERMKKRAGIEGKVERVEARIGEAEEEVTRH